MLPLFPFAAGLLAGAVAVKLLRSEFTRDGIEAAKHKLRQASASGLSSVEKVSAAARKQKTAPATDKPDAPKATKRSAHKKTGAPTTSRTRKKATPETVS